LCCPNNAFEFHQKYKLFEIATVYLPSKDTFTAMLSAAVETVEAAHPAHPAVETVQAVQAAHPVQPSEPVYINWNWLEMLDNFLVYMRGCAGMKYV